MSNTTLPDTSSNDSPTTPRQTRAAWLFRWGKTGVAGANPTEQKFLRGPQPRGFELARALRISWELIKGFRRFHFVGPCVTVFGSARFPQEHPYYQMARELGAELAKNGFTVMTGGGPGIMEAANRGAKEAGGLSVGCNIVLPQEQKPNPYLDEWVTFRYFFVRKVMLVKYSYAFIAMPGGFGTLDEFFEVATLIQTGKIADFPVVLMGREFWNPMLHFFQHLQTERTIDVTDRERVIVSDSPVEVAAIVRDASVKRFGLKYGPRPRRRWFLGE